MNYEPLELPSDEIGWSDESFDLALLYVMRTMNLSEVMDMGDWLTENVEKNLLWAYGRQVAFGGFFKRSILLNFQNFQPSAMQNAYNYVKQNPHKDLKLRNVKATVVQGILFFIATLSFIFLFYMLISNLVSN